MIDAAGCLVTPGLVDLHTHVYVGGSELVIPADEVCSVSGCTTVVDAGTAGANTMLGLRELARSHIRTRVYAFVHISGIGLAGHPHGESRDLLYLDPQLAARCVLSYRGFVLGVKVRQTQGLVGENGLEPLRRAVQAATLARARLEELSAVPPHPGPPAARPGGGGGRCGGVRAGGGGRPGDGALRQRPRPPLGAAGLAAPGGRRHPRLQRGHQRRPGRGGPGGGQRLGGPPAGGDLGRGARAGSFSYRVARACAEQGFWPDTISTDLHSASVNAPVVDLPTTMSKFLSLGMSLEDVVARSTSAPAGLINQAFRYRPGSPCWGRSSRAPRGTAPCSTCSGQ